MMRNLYLGFCIGVVSMDAYHDMGRPALFQALYFMVCIVGGVLAWREENKGGGR